MDEVSGPFCKVEFSKTNINSPVQLKEFLLSQGWEPTQWTAPTKLNPNGSPQITEDSFHTIKGDMGKLLAERAVLKHRLGMLFSVSKDGELKGWINTVRDDGRLEAGGIPQGTPTGRMRHIGIVNVPKADEKIPYGIQLRSLFVAGEGCKLVDIDAAALEARIEAHYCYPYPGGKHHAETLLSGDIHSETAAAIGVDRPTAKTVRYASMYGAQPKKIAATLGCSLKRGEEIYKGFWDSNSPLKTLNSAVKSAYKSKGFLKGLDGRKLLIRSEHALINTLFQSGGSIVVKTALCYIAARSKHLAAKQVGFFHDEGLYGVKESDVEEFCTIAEKSFEDAGKFWGLNVPLVGEAHVGDRWSEVH